ncbi:uncharacterized protein [Diadema antillarum]|uniref:uncharacterized protein n=1 Tax=Diadema antillarum TaxID=105358 RepID=UPI003A842B7E
MMMVDLKQRLKSHLFLTVVLDLFVTGLVMGSTQVWNKVQIQHPLGSTQPVARTGAAVWQDLSSEVVWIFGGQGALQGRSPSGTQTWGEAQTLDDFWQLDLRTHSWTEVKHNGTTAWPEGRHHAVACGNVASPVLAAGVAKSGVRRTDIWRFNVSSKLWQLEAVNSNGVLENATHVWCSNTGLFSLQWNTLRPWVMQYHWDNKTWMEVARGQSDRTLSGYEPDLRNAYSYPHWPSEEGFLLVYAPLMGHVMPNAIKSEQCSMWLLDRHLRWQRLISVCVSYRNCSKLLYLKHAKPAAPSCRRHSATWTDSKGNVWLYGGLSSGVVIDDMWMFNMTTKLWRQLGAACKDQSTHDTCPESPHPSVNPVTWVRNSTLYLLDGNQHSASNNVTFWTDLWTLELPDFSNDFTLAVPPIGIFLITLSLTVILSLGTCIIIVLAKCSSPLAPRIRPPSRTYGQVSYSPVNVDEVA